MNQITIAQIFESLNRNRLKSALAFLFVMLLTVAGFLLWPRTYDSEGRLFVQLGRNNTGLNPTSGNLSVSIQDSRETEILSVTELIGSRAVIDEVVQQVGAEKILWSPTDEWFAGFQSPAAESVPVESDVATGGLTAEEYRRLSQQEKAAKKLEDHLEVFNTSKTSVITIRARASSPQLAQEIVKTIMAVARDKHLDVHMVEGSTRFFDREFEKREQDLDQAIAMQTEFRKRMGILSIDGARDTLQAIIQRLENELITAEAELAQAEKSCQKYEDEIVKISDTIEVPTTGVERQSFEDSRTELYKLEAERAKLQGRYQPGHPALAEIELAIQQARESLRAIVSERTESAKQLNPIYEKVMVSYVDSSVTRDAAESRLVKISQKFVESQKELERLNDVQIEADQLQRNIDVARQYLQAYAIKRGEAQVIDQLDKQRISDVVVAQPANLVLKHISPRGSVVLPIGFIAALLAAFAIALFSDRNRLAASLNEEQVEELIGLPVLVTLPRVYSSRSMIN